MSKNELVVSRGNTPQKQRLSSRSGWVGLLDQVTRLAHVFPVGGSKEAAEDILAPYYDQVGFSLSILALCGTLASIDGAPNQKEFKAFRSHFPLPSAKEETLLEYFQDVEKHKASAPLFYVRHIACMLEDNKALREEFLHRLISMSLTDGAPHAREIHLLHMVSSEIGVSNERFVELFKRELSRLAQNPYELLDVSRRVAAENIRSVYHHRLKALHPDTLQRYTTDPTVLEVVHESLSILRISYHQLCKKRGIR